MRAGPLRVVSLMLLVLSTLSSQEMIPVPSQRDQALICEASNLWMSAADEIWPSASGVRPPVVFIETRYEYAVNFPSALAGYTNLGESLKCGTGLQGRKRTLATDLSASFSVEGVPAAVMGTPEALGKNAAEWVLTLAHEMFHVFQASKGSYAKVASLEIGARDDASWQLNFRFPYHDVNILRLIHLQGYLAWLAAGSNEAGDSKYNLGTALEAAQVYKSALTQMTGDEKAYRYSSFQEWTEGVAAYTEFKLAEKAATGGYRPTQEYSSLPNVVTYQQVWKQSYKERPFLAKHAGRAAKNRFAFYHLGMAKALALDKVNPGWKQKYFDANVWLDDLLLLAVSSR
jgi:hypothetical protein